ncbi:uncharacterized protein LOC144161594 [Haemaphysalis longicornis]
MFNVFVATVLVLLHSGTGQDIDLENALIHAARIKHLRDGQHIDDFEFGNRPGYRRPPKYGPVKLHRASIEFMPASSLEITSAVALEQWYDNHQNNKPLFVKLTRSTKRSTTVVSQVLRGVRSTFKTDLSVTIPGSQVTGKGATSVSLAMDLRNRTSEIVVQTETFDVEQTVKVPPKKSTHVRWIIQEQRMSNVELRGSAGRAVSNLSCCS